MELANAPEVLEEKTDRISGKYAPYTLQTWYTRAGNYKSSWSYGNNHYVDSRIVVTFPLGSQEYGNWTQQGNKKEEPWEYTGNIIKKEVWRGEQHHRPQWLLDAGY